MSITIAVPGSLKGLLNGSNQATCEGKTIRECIDALDSKIPGFKNKVLDEKGEINKSFMIFLDGQNLRILDGLATSVKDGDEVNIIPFAAGG
ncbi:MoaD and/or ThiS family [Smithella sp. ME-1]|uniref:Molybdenum cofactor biosynthesis protein moad n=1 Tax=hydrocarbon metagenome TaxID=938273 RepID=A0A0W8FN72_9ZZZZ|nr:MoaD and/or ThiS family [Smithella sp. ME-1]